GAASADGEATAEGEPSPAPSCVSDRSASTLSRIISSRSISNGIRLSFSRCLCQSRASGACSRSGASPSCRAWPRTSGSSTRPEIHPDPLPGSHWPSGALGVRRGRRSPSRNPAGSCKQAYRGRSSAPRDANSAQISLRAGRIQRNPATLNPIGSGSLDCLSFLLRHSCLRSQLSHAGRVLRGQAFHVKGVLLRRALFLALHLDQV